MTVLAFDADNVTVTVAVPEFSFTFTSATFNFPNVAKYAFKASNKPLVAALPVTVPGTGEIVSV